MLDFGGEEPERRWRKDVVREIDRALGEGRPIDPAALGGGDRARTAEIEALVELRTALRDEGLDADASDDAAEASNADPRAEVERLLSESVESGEAVDVSGIEAEHPELKGEIDELKRFYRFLSDALTGEAPPLETSGRLPERRLGRFVLKRVIAPHPLGRLDAAVEERTGARRVLLLLNRTLPKAAALRVLRDAVAVRRMNDPGFVPIVEISEADDVRFLAFEDVDGTSVDVLLAAAAAPDAPKDVFRLAARRPVIDGAVPVPESGRAADPARIPGAARLAAAVAATLHRAHGQGVLQLDLRPINVLATADGRVLLRASNLMGALRAAWRGVGAGKAFLAPEALASDGRACDWRADVYGVAALLYALLVLEAPPADAEARRARLAGLPQPLIDLVLAGLASDPAARPASCLVTAERLAPFARGGGAASRVVAAVASFGRRLRRRRP